MGGLFGKNRAPTNDPFYRPVPPVGPVPPPGLGPTGSFDVYDPNAFVTLTTIGSYGGPVKRQPDPYGGRYAQGGFQ